MREKRRGRGKTFIAVELPSIRLNTPHQQLRCHLTRRMAWRSMDFGHPNMSHPPFVWWGVMTR